MSCCFQWTWINHPLNAFFRVKLHFLSGANPVLILIAHDPVVINGFCRWAPKDTSAFHTLKNAHGKGFQVWCIIFIFCTCIARCTFLHTFCAHVFSDNLVKCRMQNSINSFNNMWAWIDNLCIAKNVVMISSRASVSFFSWTKVFIHTFALYTGGMLINKPLLLIESIYRP